MYKTLAELNGEMSVSALSNLYVVHINIVSLLKNFDKLELFLNQLPCQVDIICLSETRLTFDKIAMTNINGYNFFYCNSPDRASGSGMYVSKRLKCRQLQQNKINCEGCEDVWVEIISKTTVVVGSVYRHPSGVLSEFEEAYLNSLKKIRKQNYLVLGDFNINYNKLSVAPSSIANYANSINLLGCNQIVDKPTRITNSASSIIDHIYANQNLLINIYPRVITYDISDHLPLLVEYKTFDIKKFFSASSSTINSWLDRKFP